MQHWKGLFRGFSALLNGLEVIGPLLAQVHLPALTMFLQPSQFRPLSLKHYSLSSLPLRTPNLPNQGQELEELRAVLCPERWTSVRNLNRSQSEEKGKPEISGMLARLA